MHVYAFHLRDHRAIWRLCWVSQHSSLSAKSLLVSGFCRQEDAHPLGRDGESRGTMKCLSTGFEILSEHLQA